MSYIEINNLHNSYIFISKKPSRVKYEVYTNGVVLIAELTIYRDDSLGVKSRDLISLSTAHENIENAFTEIKNHFEENYA
ncbi:hypothetical protein ACQKDS_04660 [Serratia sp. NPDC078593]|uniref:hypothetical protein n=1 Tax=unclassified Serratia (in: enterobacteria) TaxID=2647522 RepID=UPI0037D2799D